MLLDASCCALTDFPCVQFALFACVNLKLLLCALTMLCWYLIVTELLWNTLHHVAAAVASIALWVVWIFLAVDLAPDGWHHVVTSLVAVIDETVEQG